MRAAGPHKEKRQHHQLADAVIGLFSLDMQSSDCVFVADFK